MGFNHAFHVLIVNYPKSSVQCSRTLVSGFVSYFLFLLLHGKASSTYVNLSKSLSCGRRDILKGLSANATKTSGFDGQTV